jgi:hypothetical protein
MKGLTTTYSSANMPLAISYLMPHKSGNWLICLIWGSRGRRERSAANGADGGGVVLNKAVATMASLSRGASGDRDSGGVDTGGVRRPPLSNVAWPSSGTAS